jgi:hypothetical protein
MLNACLWLFGKEEEILDLKEDLKLQALVMRESQRHSKKFVWICAYIYGTPAMEAAAYRF